jgi:hypothetical protein
MANTTLLYRRNWWNGLKAIIAPHFMARRVPSVQAAGLDGSHNRIVFGLMVGIVPIDEL